MTLIGIAYTGLTRALPDRWLAQAGFLSGVLCAITPKVEPAASVGPAHVSGPFAE